MDTLVNKLINLKSSTTKFLEAITKNSLQAEVIFQLEDANMISRSVVLFFDDPEKPVLYSESKLNRKNLTSYEYHLLTTSSKPLGRIFTTLNITKSITKANVEISTIIETNAFRKLNIESTYIYKKKYDFLVAERNIGQITEYFNEESLARL